MDAVKILQNQIKGARETFEGTVADVAPEQLHVDPGGKALPLGSLYAHLLLSEDAIVQGMLQGKAPLSATTYKDKTGVDKPMPSFEVGDWPKENEAWAKSVQIDLPTLRGYAKAVYAQTDAYVESLTEDILKKELDLGAMGKNTVIHIVSGFLIGHTYSITGEISILKGLQGAKGYPF